MNGYVFGLVPVGDFGNPLKRSVLACRGILPRGRNGYYPDWAMLMYLSMWDFVRAGGWSWREVRGEFASYCRRCDWRSLDPFGKYNLQRAHHLAIAAWLLRGECLWSVRL